MVVAVWPPSGIGLWPAVVVAVCLILFCGDVFAGHRQTICRHKPTVAAPDISGAKPSKRFQIGPDNAVVDNNKQPRCIPQTIVGLADGAMLGDYVVQTGIKNECLIISTNKQNGGGDHPITKATSPRPENERTEKSSSITKPGKGAETSKEPVKVVETTTTSTTRISSTTEMSHCECLYEKSWKLEKAVRNGTTINFTIELCPQAETFQFNLLHDAPEFHPHIGATMLRIQWFKENDTIFLGSFHHRKWTNAENFTNTGFVKPDDMLQCVLTIDYADSKTKNAIIEIKLNNHRIGAFLSDLPIWSLNWLQLSGGITILDEPHIEYGKENFDLIKYELPHLFNYGNTICFEAKMKEEFTMYLFHESNEFSETIGDTLLRMHVDTSSEDLSFDRRLNHENKWTEDEQGGGSVFYKRNNEEILIQIVAEDNKFKVVLNGKKVGSLNYEDTNPWLVNWITLEGLAEVNIAESSNRCKKVNTTVLSPLPSNIMQIYPYNLLIVGNEIHITGIVKEGEEDFEGVHADPEVNVYLFHEALNWHERFGQTVLRVQFTKQEFNLNSYIPDCTPNKCTKKWQKMEQIAPRSKIDKPLEAGQKFELHIKALGKTMFEVQYGTHTLKWADEGIPLWAIQYIMVKGLDEKQGIKIENVMQQHAKK